MTSEYKLGIEEVADYQCSNINHMIGQLGEATTILEAALLAVDPQTAVQAVKECHHRIKESEETLEEFRAAIEDVRRWGNDWKELAKQKINKYEPEMLTDNTGVIDFDDITPF